MLAFLLPTIYYDAVLFCVEFNENVEDGDRDEVSAADVDSFSNKTTSHCTSQLPSSRVNFHNQRSHRARRPITRSVCSQTFSQHSSLKLHACTGTHREQQNCPVSKSTFPECSRLDHHFLTDKDEQSSLEHYQIDNEQQPSVCSVCQHKCSGSDSLRRHMRIHKAKPSRLKRRTSSFSCNICGRSFTRSTSLKRHLRIYKSRPDHLKHRDAEPAVEPLFTCSVCGRSFKRSHGLKRHMSWHRGERPYCCFVCGGRFSLSYGLALHLRSHTGEHPYTCSVCQGRFTQSCSLKRHMLTHSGVKMHRCGDCSGKFATAFSLKRHVARAHLQSVANKVGKNVVPRTPLSSPEQCKCIQLRYRMGADFKLQLQNTASFAQDKDQI